MRITLRMGDKKQTFESGFVPARLLRNTIEKAEKMQKGEIKEVEMFDIMASYIVDVYKKQFTIDNVLDGLSFEELTKEFYKAMGNITNKLNSGLDIVAVIHDVMIGEHGLRELHLFDFRLRRPAISTGFGLRFALGFGFGFA